MDTTFCSDEFYYHGTQWLAAYYIMHRGFQIGDVNCGRDSGAGLYITPDPGFASNWGKIIVKCRLAPNTKILWLKEPDPRVLKYLKKEFGAQILDLDFYKAIPRNKTLTRNEFINLFSYIILKKKQKLFNRQRVFVRWEKFRARLGDYLRRHKYDGFGHTDPEWPEVVIMNPSLVIPVSFHRCWESEETQYYWVPKVKLSPPLSRKRIDKTGKRLLRQYAEEQELRDLLDGMPDCEEKTNLIAEVENLLFMVELMDCARKLGLESEFQERLNANSNEGDHIGDTFTGE